MVILGPKTGKTVKLTGYAVGPAPVSIHEHLAVVDIWGDGFTTTDAKHRHPVREGKVCEAEGHSHGWRNWQEDEGSNQDAVEEVALEEIAARQASV